MNILPVLKNYTEPTPAQKTDWAEEARLERERFAVREAERQIRATNIPARHRQTCVTAAVSPWWDKFNSIQSKLGTGVTIALVGSRGCGKTQLAVELIRGAVKTKTAYFCTAMEFFLKIKSTFVEGSGETELGIVKKYREFNLLVVDEIGKRAESDWHNNLFFELLNKRYEDMSDTILIDNRPKAEFISLIGPSLASRMNEAGGIIECNWPSFR